MDTSTVHAVHCRMAQMQHLVIHDVAHSDFRRLRRIEERTQDYGMMRWIVVSESCAARTNTPAQLWRRHQAAEKPDVEIVKNVAQVVGRSARVAKKLAPPFLLYQVQRP